MPSDPEKTLLQGSELLKPLFTKHGFDFVPLDKGKSSGGHFASAEFIRGDRRFEFHLRFSLGMVTYHLGVSVPKILARFLPEILARLRIPKSDKSPLWTGAAGSGGKEDVGDAEATRNRDSVEGGP